MSFHLIGVNHKSAPVEVRERLAIPDSRLPEALKSFTRHPGVEEGLILSTCNRVELLAQTQNGGADLRAFLRDYFQLDDLTLDPHLYEYRQQDAVRHVFRVAASLDSMVVGEAQILGQVKEAYATARAVGADPLATGFASDSRFCGRQAGAHGDGGRVVGGIGRLGRRGACQEDFRITARQACLSGGRRQDE